MISQVGGSKSLPCMELTQVITAWYPRWVVNAFNSLGETGSAKEVDKKDRTGNIEMEGTKIYKLNTANNMAPKKTFAKNMG